MRALMTALALATLTAGCALVLGYGDEARLDPGLGADAGEDAAGPGVCGSFDRAPTFCTSFDEADPFSVWAHHDAPDGGGSLAIATTPVRTPPNALAASLASGMGAAVSNAFRDLENRAFTATIGFDFYVDASDPGGQYGVLSDAFIFAASGVNFIVQFVCSHFADGLGCSMTEVLTSAGGSTAHDLTGSLTERAWHRARITLDVKDPFGKYHVHVDVDDSPRLDADFLQSGVGGVPNFDLGVVAIGPGSSPWTVYYDDVFVDAVAR